MKRIFLIATLSICFLTGLVQGQQINTKVEWKHKFVADTAGTTKLADTSYSAVFNLRTTSSFFPDKIWDNLQFYFRVIPCDSTFYKDSNWTNDTFFVNFQTGALRNDGTYHWVKSQAIDTFVVRDSNFSTVVLKRNTTIFGEWARIQLIRRDSLEATAQTKTGLGYGEKVEVYTVPWY